MCLAYPVGSVSLRGDRCSSTFHSPLSNEPTRRWTWYQSSTMPVKEKKKRERIRDLKVSFHITISCVNVDDHGATLSERPDMREGGRPQAKGTTNRLPVTVVIYVSAPSVHCYFHFCTSMSTWIPPNGINKK